MKKLIALTVLSLTLTGCASLNTALFRDAEKLGTKADVLKEFGEPTEFFTSESGNRGFVYKKGPDICAVVFDKRDRVIDTACRKNQNYVNPVAAFFAGFGKGMQDNSQARQPTNTNINCTSNTFGSSTYTNCY